MMPLLALGAATTAPLVVDIAGMPPQLNIIRAEAAKNGWAITCEGRSGEEGVLRLKAAAGEPSEKLDAFVDDPNRVGSSYWTVGFDEQPSRESCDYDEPAVSSDKPASALSYSAPEFLAELLPIAKDCGFAHAFIRPLKDTDPGYAQVAEHQGWQVLDAGEDADKRYGPAICYLQLSFRKFPKDELRRSVPPRKP